MDCLEHNFEIGGAGVIIFQILVYTMVVFYDEPGEGKNTSKTNFSSSIERRNTPKTIVKSLLRQEISKRLPQPWFLVCFSFVPSRLWAISMSASPLTCVAPIACLLTMLVVILCFTLPRRVPVVSPIWAHAHVQSWILSFLVYSCRRWLCCWILQHNNSVTR